MLTNPTMVYVVAGFFFVMGIGALLRPDLVARCFGVAELPRAMRNEIRAVYGGFGVAIGCALIAAPKYTTFGPGIVLGVAVALLGMALGRLVGLLIDRRIDGFPSLFLGLEVALAGILMSALKG